MSLDSFSASAIFYIVLLCSIALHEFGHAWVADKRGDPLPRSEGRVTLDPFAHLTPIGSFLIPGVMIFGGMFFGGMPIALIGWGKPVMLSLPNPKTRKLDDILITLAGPGMNVLIAFVAAVALGVAYAHGYQVACERLFLPAMCVNVSLAVFNLLPIPPLDGSHVMRYAVGMSDTTYALLAANSWWVLLVLINIPATREVFQWLAHTATTPFFTFAETIAQLF